MDYDAISSALRTKLEAVTLSPTMPFVWPNMNFKPETDGGERGWLYGELSLHADEQSSFGNPTVGNYYRSTGLFVVNVIVPRGDKIGRAETLATAIRLHFKSESISGIHFTNRWIGSGRLNEQDSRWFALPVLMEFWADRLEAPA